MAVVLSQSWSLNVDLKSKLSSLPHKSGCYLMKDKDGKIIYVGKAIDLNKRVNSYFKGAHDYKTTKLVSNIKDFDFIVVKNEKEALILEYNLIKQYDPKYNIVFKDDQSYPYIFLDTKQCYVGIVRLKKNKKYKGKLFGPYPNVDAARKVVDLINNLYPSQKCYPLKKNLCLYYHMHQCLGFCKFDISDSEKEEINIKIEKFLKGESKDIKKELKEKMDYYASQLKYEEASKYRDLLKNVDYIVDSQTVEITQKQDFDVVNYEIEDSYICIVQLFIRNGKLLSSKKYIENLIGDSENFVSQYLYNYYQKYPCKHLYVNKELLAYVENAFDFKVETSARGQKYQLLKKAKENASEQLKLNKNIIKKKDDYYQNIQEELNKIFNSEIKRIELFDNSHNAGKQTVGVVVVYDNLKPRKDKYRLFKLEDSFDDLASMYELMYRRYFNLLKNKEELPDLIIVDGGINQINVAKRVIEELNLKIKLAGLRKDDKHNTSQLLDINGEVINIENKYLFFHLANMQEEVHRYAITYMRKRSNRATYVSVLDSVKGIGKKRKEKLLKKYGSLKKIKTLSLKQLEEDLPAEVAKALYTELGEKNARER